MPTNKQIRDFVNFTKENITPENYEEVFLLLGEIIKSILNLKNF